MYHVSCHISYIIMWCIIWCFYIIIPGLLYIFWKWNPEQQQQQQQQHRHRHRHRHRRRRRRRQRRHHHHHQQQQQQRRQQQQQQHQQQQPTVPNSTEGSRKRSGHFRMWMHTMTCELPLHDSFVQCHITSHMMDSSLTTQYVFLSCKKHGTYPFSFTTSMFFGYPCSARVTFIKIYQSQTDAKNKVRTC